MKSRLVFLAAGALLALLSCSRTVPEYDLVITGGLVIDGTGNPWFRADVGVKDGRVAAVRDRLNAGRAARLIKAEGLAVAPGFIDIHTHADSDILRIPTADNYVMQGVTTVVGGNCGGHEFPLSELWSGIKEQGISCNFGSLAGHNTIRRRVMGMKMSEPTQEELESMKALLRQEMRAGALGLSTGLAYLPGTYSRTEELVALGSVMAEFGGFYASHIRNQGRSITEAIEEAIAVGEANRVPVEISHIKLADEAVWNENSRITGPVESARARGVEVTLDQYPYTATSSGFTSSLPQDVFEGGRDRFLERLADPAVYDRVKRTVIANRLTSARGIDKLASIYIASSREHPEFEGRNLREILVMQGKPVDAEQGADLIIDIVRSGDASAVFFQMDEKDVEALMRLPYVMIGSDGGLQVPGVGSPHPRSYGTFPRVIGEYSRRRKTLPLEEAVRKMTSLPAQTMRLRDRGLLREGMRADIVVFDPREFTDGATFSEPHRFPPGLRFVIVNGEPVVEEGKHTGRRPGQPVFGPGCADDN
jgi:N-acyl-D-amino-acid deacylase